MLKNCPAKSSSTFGCWITATVLEYILTTDKRGDLPKKMTDMYSLFLMVQTSREIKYHEGHERNPQE